AEKKKATEQPVGKGQDAARRARLLDFHTSNLTFSGAVFLTKSKEIASAQATAITAAAHTSTPDDIRIAMFTDASRPSVPGPDPGGYSLVFDNFFPGTTHYGQHVEMGWFMPEMEDTTIGEGLGIAQAFEVARRYLDNCSSSASENVVRSVNISIISDAYTVIDMIDGGVPPRKRIHAKIWSLIRQKSHELRSVSGNNVTVERRWVPGHSDILGNDHADHTAVRARELQRDVFAVDLVEKEEEFQQCQNYRHQEIVDMDFIDLQLREDFQQWEAHRHQESVNMGFICLQLQEEDQRWSPVYEVRELALRELPLVCPTMDLNESLSDEMVQAAVGWQLVTELKDASNRVITPLGVPLFLVAS
ncbi:uncharacterized protein B0T23DRAFT_315515, partial [Neurospora hispaniola]